MADEIKKEWDLTPLLESEKEEVIKAKIIEASNQANFFVNKWKERKDYLENEVILKEALDNYEFFERNYSGFGGLGFYFHLKKMKYQTDSKTIASYNKIDELNKKMSNDMSFFLLNLGKIDISKQNEFLKSELLSSYHYFLKRVFDSAKYDLSEKEEKIINLMSANAYEKWVSMMEAAISNETRKIEIDGKMETKVFEELLKLVRSKDKKLRDSAAEKVNEILEKNADYAVNEINAVLSFKKTYDELKGYERPDKTRHVSDGIDSQAVDSLVSAVTKRFDISKRFYELKAKLMGVDKLKYHERNVDYGNIDKNYNYEEAVELVNNVFKRLDNEFFEIYDKFNKEGKIDVYPVAGKMGGAFCAHQNLISPTYVLLNYTNKLDDVRVIAHEMGHAINNELSKNKQNALNYGTSLATAEVASTFMEDFVNDEILKNSDEETRFYLLVQKVSDEIGSIMRQVACYNFEHDLHNEFREKGHLSKEDIGKIFQKNMSLYMGDYVEQSRGSENWWIYWGHIRTYFYVYSYASGLLISKALQSEVRKDFRFIGKVKEFLSSGISDSPRNIFLKLGIDITKREFWEKGLDEIENLVNECEKLAKKLGKI